MTTPSQFLAQAASYIGVSGDYNEFNRWYWCDLNGYDYDPGWAWCACFQSYVGVHDLGMPFNPSASAAGVAWQGDRIDDSQVQPGDWVLFNWDGRQDFGWADHIGVVEWSDINGSGYFGTIEGNTNNSEVARCTRYNLGGYATAFFRPPYDYDDGSPKKDMKEWPLIVWSSHGGDNQKFKLEKKDDYYMIRNIANNKVIDVHASELKGDVNLYEAHGEANQLWKLVKVDDLGMYEIESKLNKNYVLDVVGGSVEEGTELCLWPRNKQVNQRWHLMDNGDGTFTIVSNVNKKLVLDAANGGK